MKTPQKPRQSAKDPRKPGELRSKDVAHILDCSPDDVIEWAKKGDLKGVKVGRFWRFRLPDVLSYKRRVLAEEARESVGRKGVRYGSR